MEQKLEGYDINTTSEDKSENIRIIYAGGDRTYGTYYTYNVKEDKLTKIADLAPWIKEEDMVPMHPITYTSRDGLTIEGYLHSPERIHHGECQKSACSSQSAWGAVGT